MIAARAGVAGGNGGGVLGSRLLLLTFPGRLSGGIVLCHALLALFLPETFVFRFFS